MATLAILLSRGYGKEKALFEFYNENFTGVLGKDLIKRLLTNVFLVAGSFLLDYALTQIHSEKLKNYKLMLSNKILAASEISTN